MELVHVKEVFPLLDRENFFSILNERDRDKSLQHIVEGIINMVEIISILLKKQTQILIFSLLSIFHNLFMLYWSLRVTSVLILNIIYFLSLFVIKCLHVFIEQRKR